MGRREVMFLLGGRSRLMSGRRLVHGLTGGHGEDVRQLLRVCELQLPEEVRLEPQRE